MNKLLLFLLLPTLSFGQKQATTYAAANPGVLSVMIDLSSDTAHLYSLIGTFDNNDVSKLKTFLNSREALDLQRHSGGADGHTAAQVENLLHKVLNRTINPCRIVASDTSYAVFNSPLENEVIRPLILLVKKSYPMCQMQTTILGLGAAKQNFKY